MTHPLVIGALVVLVLAGCGGAGSPADKPPAVPATISLQSPQFRDGGTIPRTFTCDGGGSFPALSWSGAPDRTSELALTVDDPDAPNGTFRHWTLWHLSPRLRRIEAGRTPDGSRTANNSSGRPGWTDPCPPNGDPPHHYVFTLYALKTPLTERDGADADQTRRDISAAATASGKLTGLYGR
jgi:hypothetical protein